jgi:hypothetical protein
MRGQTLFRRIVKLEAAGSSLPVLDRQTELQVAALVMMSPEDLKIVRELVQGRDTGQELEPTPEREAVVARWEEMLRRVTSEPKKGLVVA